MRLHNASMALVACKPRVFGGRLCAKRDLQLLPQPVSKVNEARTTTISESHHANVPRSSHWLQIMPGQLILITWIA
jgi:hypothetical protein